MSYLARLTDEAAKVSFSQDELAYYARHLLLPSVGTVGQQKLKCARVLVVGAGGLGCPVLQALAGAGVGHLTVIDGDKVALSNISRQWLHRVGDVARNKAESAAEKLREHNPFIHVESLADMLDSQNVETLIESHDLVIDATDDLEVRYLIDEVCAARDKPWVHAALYRESAQLCVFWGQYGARFNQLFPERSEAPSCAGAGMLGAVASVTANLQAVEAIKLIVGNGTPKVGEVVNVHAANLQIQVFRLPGVTVPPVYESASLAAHSMSIESLKQARSIGETIRIVDLRSPSVGSLVAIPSAEMVAAEAFLEKGLLQLGAQKVLLVCEFGSVSNLLADALRSRGHEQVFHLEGGYDEAAFN